MSAISPWHIAILVIVLVVLFGAKKLPDAARGLGRSMRIFKSEMQEMQNESGHTGPPSSPSAPAQKVVSQPAEISAPSPETSAQVEADRKTA